MTKRRIGRSDLRVSPFCLGGNVFGWTADEAATFRLLDAFVDAGFDFIDTADVYSRWAPGHRGGESESMIGRWFAANRKRNKIILATKVGMDMGEDKGASKKGLKPSYIREAVEASLRRLKTDHIDLYQSHVDDMETPLEEVLTAYSALIKEGKVRAIGASNYTAERLTEALDLAESQALPRYDCLQPHFNLIERKHYQGALENLCHAREIGVIPYYGLASGFLTGKYRVKGDLAKSVRGASSVGGYLNPQGLQVLAILDELAEKHGATPAQVALAWLMARSGITAPIASATSMEQLKELLGAVNLTLETADIMQLDHSLDEKSVEQ